MVISDKHSFIFIHVQKTGGVSMETALLKEDPEAVTQLVSDDARQLSGRHHTAMEIRECLGEQRWDRYFKFAFVRNPWERLVSWYNMMRSRNFESHSKSKFWTYVGDNSHDFKSFLKNCTDVIEEDDGLKKCIRFNQIDYVTDKEGKIIVDFIGRFENIREDFATACDTIRMTGVRLPFKNQYNHTHYSRYYDKETENIVRDMYSRDIKEFGYRFKKRTFFDAIADRVRHVTKGSATS